MYPARLAEDLRDRGGDVVAVVERPELRQLEDEALLMAATAEERVVVTENVADFPEIVEALARVERGHYGVIVVSSHTFPRTDRGFGMLVRGLERYLSEHEADQVVVGGIHWLRPVAAGS